MRYFALSCAVALFWSLSLQVAAVGASACTTFTATTATATATAPAPPAAHHSASPVVASGGRVVVANVHPSSLAILAQTIAASQIADTGRQLLTINTDGTANGGTMYATNVKGDFIVPQNVKAILDFSNNASMSISNDFINNGTVYCVAPSNPQATNVSITANSIVNNSEIVSDLALSLTSKNSFINQGTVHTATGNLSITTHGALANFGTICSPQGDVVFNGTSNAFEIGNAGHVYAVNGSIVVNQPSKLLNTLNINGGDWTAKSIQVNAPNSNVHFVANDISAQVSASARSLQIGASVGAVNLGTAPAKTSVVSAPQPEALEVSNSELATDEGEYILETDAD